MRPRLLVGAVALFAGFAAWSGFVLSRPVLGLDVTLERGVQAIPWGPLAVIFPVFDQLAGLRQVVLALALVGLVGVLRRPALWLMLAGALEGPVYSALNQVLRRPRPSAQLVRVSDHVGAYSYPSGHTVFFLVFGVLLVICLAWRQLPGWLTGVVALAALIVLIEACISRLYLGDHWPSDVFAGLLLGGGWTCLVLSVRRLSDPVLEA